MFDDISDVDFDLLLDDLRQDAISVEDCSSVSCNTSANCSLALLAQKLETKKAKTFKKSKVEDDSSIDSDIVMARPRILKTDIRRSYATMLFNVMNNCDFPLLYGFFETFFCPNMQSSLTRPIHNGIRMDDVTHEQQGIQNLAMYWYSSLLTVPDAVLKIKDCNVVSPLNSSESQVVTNYNFQATLMLEELPSNYVDCPTKFLVAPVVSTETVCKKRNKANENNEKSKTLRNLMASVDNAVKNLSVRSTPFQIDAEGRVTMYLDENKRVKKIEFKCYPTDSMKQTV